MPFVSLKMGPGDSARSHTADEYIGIEEIGHGIELYVRMLDQIITGPNTH
jgi:acetylornithine deacetylase